jgi:hypothetical protein
MTHPYVPEQPGSGDINVGYVSGTGIAIGHGAQAIVTIYQTVLRPLPVNLSSLVRPLIEHYTAVFGGRDAELAGLDAFLADTQHPFGLLVAPTGLGKTALLVHWIARLKQQHPQWRIIFAPVSLRYQTASEQVTLGILAHSLAEIHNDLEQFRSYEQSPSSLRALIADYLRCSLPTGTQLLVVLDGIDEAEAIGWKVGSLCAVPPQPGLKIVVAARQRANATHDDWCHHLGWDSSTVAPLVLSQLDCSAIEALLRQSDPALAADPAFVNQFYRVSEGDPLTCNLLVKALLGGNLTPGSLTQRPPGLEAFLQDWVEMLRKRRQVSRPIRELLAICAVAYGPLTSDDLQALAPEVFLEQADIVDAVHDDEVARFIITVGEAQHSYVFSHQRLREVFLEQLYPVKDRERLQQRLIAYGDRWHADRSQPLPDYLRQFWIAHLKAAKEWGRIRQVVTEIVPSADGQRYLQPWQTARYAAEGSDTGYLSDLDLLWGWADDQGDLGLALRCALIAASLRSRSGNLIPKLLVQLVKIGTPEGRWSAAAALEQIAHMPNAWNQAQCLEALLVAGISLPWQRAVEIACTLTDETNRARALTALSQHLPPGQQTDILAQALAAAQTIDYPWLRVRALIAIVPQLPPNQQTDILAQALAAAQIIDYACHRAETLIALSQHLPPDQQADVLAQALTAAQNGESICAGALATLAPYLPSDQQADILAQALAATQTIVDEQIRARELATLAPYLPSDQQADILAQALAAAQTIVDEQIRAMVLVALVPALARLPTHLALTLATIQTIKYEALRAQAITALAPALAGVPTLLAEALAAASIIESETARAEVLAALAPQLPPNQQTDILAQALVASRVIADEGVRDGLLSTLASAIARTPALIAQALVVASAIESNRVQAEVLTALVPQLPPDKQTDVLTQAFAAVSAIESDSVRAWALAALAPTLDIAPSLLFEALATIRTIEDEYSRAGALRALAPQLAHTPTLLAQAVETACAIADDEIRAEVLTSLVPQLPPDQQTDVLAMALETASAIQSESARALALYILAPYLPPDQQTDVLAQALATASTIENEYDRARSLADFAYTPALLSEVLAATSAIEYKSARIWALATIAPHLPPDQQTNILAQALATASTIENEYSRATAIINLAPTLASTPALLVQAFEIACLIDDEQLRSWTFAALAPHMPPDQQADLLTHAHAIEHESARVWVLAALAPQLPPDQQANVLTAALSAACAIDYEENRARALAALAPAIASTPTLLAQAFESARAISYEEDRAGVVGALAPALASMPALLTEALTVAHAINDEYYRANALSALAPAVASTPALDPLLVPTLRILVRRGRPALLRDLAVLTPWLTSVTHRAGQSAALIGLSTAIIETARCWP